jgi:hypothetical protein
MRVRLEVFSAATKIRIAAIGQSQPRLHLRLTQSTAFDGAIGQYASILLCL